MNVETGAVKPYKDLTKEEKTSGKWKPVTRAQRVRSKLTKKRIKTYTTTGPYFLTTAERRKKRKAQRAARKRQRRSA
jgi:hypothetical protein